MGVCTALRYRLMLYEFHEDGSRGRGTQMSGCQIHPAPGCLVQVHGSWCCSPMCMRGSQMRVMLSKCSGCEFGGVMVGALAANSPMCCFPYCLLEQGSAWYIWGNGAESQGTGGLLSSHWGSKAKSGHYNQMSWMALGERMGSSVSYMATSTPISCLGAKHPLSMPC